ncbi:MAG TPA: tRNA (N(6)-L-threonylcarbamoyladenosine(37)-C(2))-methylthiotransferase MtaB [Bacilli bacterium]|nr:tRNA (N(6)-L-threonylcarbamoyladenosine(37)-C(2))-methylthiotransferase MtaB [Bacilli bacterium]
MTYKTFTLGCKVNAYESDAVASLLNTRGYHEANETESVDVIIINTCSVTSTSDQKSRQHIRKFHKLYPTAIIVVMGCYAQVDPESVRSLPGVAIVVGASDRHRIPDLIEQYKQHSQVISTVAKNERDFDYEDFGVTSFTHNSRAYLKIQDGCDNFCSYCIIPYSRGKLRSRPVASIITEIKDLVGHGYKEIILTGIHTGGYGKDLNGFTFSNLVETILHDVPDLFRLRISSIEENEVTPDLLSIMAKSSVMARHLHLPLQSGSSGVLKRMNRKYDTASFLSKVKMIRDYLPDIALSTDVIVGFPGETEEEFAETYNFIKQANFMRLHVFPFSPRSGTSAARMKNQVAPEVKKERVNQLIALSEALEADYEKKFVGKSVEVIFEEYDDTHHLAIGHTSNYLVAQYPSPIALHGQIKDIIFQNYTHDINKK